MYRANCMVFASVIIALYLMTLSEYTTRDARFFNIQTSKMKISIGKKTFDAVLFDNPTATSFRKMLPLTLSMTELNSNEKYSELPGQLSIKPSNPGSIRAGDLMMYGSSTLVLFYKSFPTSYSYTPIGRIEDTSGLEEAVGRGSVNVKFELK